MRLDIPVLESNFKTLEFESFEEIWVNLSRERMMYESVAVDSIHMGQSLGMQVNHYKTMRNIQYSLKEVCCQTFYFAR